MAEARSNTQLPLGMQGAAKSVLDAELEAFQEGVELGKKYAEVAIRKAAAWAEDNPGQMLLVGVAAGFVLGKLLFRPPRRVNLEDLDLD